MSASGSKLGRDERSPSDGDATLLPSMASKASVGGRKRGSGVCVPCKLIKRKCETTKVGGPCLGCLERKKECYWDNCGEFRKKRAKQGLLHVELERLETLLRRVEEQVKGVSRGTGGFDADQSEFGDEENGFGSGEGEGLGDECNDLAGMLSDMVVSPMTPDFDTAKEPGIVAEARRLLRFEQHFSSGAEGPGADPLALLHSSRPLSLNEICSALPTQEQAKVCLEAYTTNKHRFHNPFILWNLLRQWDDIWHKPIQKCHPHQIAVYFAACAAAVYGMDTEDFRRAEIFGGLSRSALTRKWGNGAMRALNFGDFMNRPSLDALRAIVLLNHYCLYMTETEVNTYTLSLTSNAVSLARTLKLHKENLGGRSSTDHVEIEDRRRVMWGMLKQIFIFTNLIGQPDFFTPPDLSGLPLPSDANDEDIQPTYVKSRSPKDPPTVTSSLRVGAKSAWLIHRARNLYTAGQKSPSNEEVMRLDAEIQAVEAEYPMAIPFDGKDFTINIQSVMDSQSPESVNTVRCIVAGALLAYAGLVLHRASIIDTKNRRPQAELHRRKVLRYSFFLLRLPQSPPTGWSTGTHFSFSAGIALGCDLLQRPESAEAPSIREHLLYAISTLTDYATASGITRRGTAILKFMLDKDERRQKVCTVHLSKKVRVDNRGAFVGESFASVSSDEELFHKPKEITKAPSDAGPLTDQKGETQDHVTPFKARQVDRLFQAGPPPSSLFEFHVSPRSPAISSTTSPAEGIARPWYPPYTVATSQTIDWDLASALRIDPCLDPAISFDFGSPFGEPISESESAYSETVLTPVGLEALLNEPIV